MESTYKTQDAHRSFSTVSCKNNDQSRIVSELGKIFKENIFGEYLRKHMQERIKPEFFVAIIVQENYDIYRHLRSEMINRGIEVSEPHLTGRLISRRIITIVWKDDVRMTTFRKFG